jgi:hypothetical protein
MESRRGAVGRLLIIFAGLPPEDRFSCAVGALSGDVGGDCPVGKARFVVARGIWTILGFSSATMTVAAIGFRLGDGGALILAIQPQPRANRN